MYNKYENPEIFLVYRRVVTSLSYLSITISYSADPSIASSFTEMCNLASSTYHELTNYEMESAEMKFGCIESLLQTFSYDINECLFLLMKQLGPIWLYFGPK